MLPAGVRPRGCSTRHARDACGALFAPERFAPITSCASPRARSRTVRRGRGALRLEWGHDFRPDYRRCATRRSSAGRATAPAGRPPIAAFTATATPEVPRRHHRHCSASRAAGARGGFDRPNIHLRVGRARPRGGQEIWAAPSRFADAAALVYAATRKQREAAGAVLRAAGVQAAAYHAGSRTKERTRVQDAFAAGTLPRRLRDQCVRHGSTGPTSTPW